MTARRSTAILLLLASFVLAQAALTETALTETALAATPRASLMNIENDVMCTSCHEPLALAQSPQAQAEKDYVKGLIAQGMTKQQIEANLVAQYGVAVLGRPPAHGFNLVVYILPPALVIGGIAFLLYTLPKWRERSRRAAQTPLSSPEKPVTQAEDERINDELARLI